MDLGLVNYGFEAPGLGGMLTNSEVGGSLQRHKALHPSVRVIQASSCFSDHQLRRILSLR